MSIRSKRVILRGIGWNHPRGIGPLRASITEYRRQRPDVHVIWNSRALWRFAYAPLAEMFQRYDLVLFDHPHIGTLADGKPPMLPLDEWLPKAYLVNQAANSVGPSHHSYAIDGHQWALAIDAAAQVSAFRPDLIPNDLSLPKHWSDIAHFSNHLPAGVRIGLPMNHTDAAVNLSTIAASISRPKSLDYEQGLDNEILGMALEILDNLVRISDPATLWMPPLLALEAMASTDSIAYIPLHFGYSNYSRPGFRQHVVKFTDIPSTNHAPVGATLGGVGLGVSRWSRHPQDAVDYAAFLASPHYQCNGYFDGGGQPGHRKAWLDRRINSASTDFFTGTITTLDNAFLRPRVGDAPWWWNQQVEIGHLLAEAAWEGTRLGSLRRELIRIDRLSRRRRPSG